MDTPKNWPGNFLYLPIAITVSFHDVLLEAFLGTGYEEDRQRVEPLIEQCAIYPHIEICILDASFSKKGNRVHPLAETKELAGHTARGVFATKAIPEGTVLGEYGGVISFSKKQYTEIPPGKINPYLWQIDAHVKKMYIDGFLATNELGFINDYHGIGERPNVLMKPIIHRGRLRFCYVTVLPIGEDEELLVDYSPF